MRTCKGFMLILIVISNVFLFNLYLIQSDSSDFFKFNLHRNRLSITL
jgi:hypothetical protein